MENSIADDLKTAFNDGYKIANIVHDEFLRVEHIVWGIINTQNTIHNMLVKNEEYDIYGISDQLDNLINQTSTKLNQNRQPLLRFDDTLRSLITNEDDTETPLTIVEFFCRVLDTDLRVSSIFTQNGINSELIRNNIKNQKSMEDSAFPNENEQHESGVKSKTDSKTPILDNFSRDFSELAKENALDPVIGREDEIERLAQILSRRKKNNPLLVGEPGVGKTAIVEGLAMKILVNECPRPLQGKRLVALDLASMVGGTKYRGEFEARIKGLMDEVKENPEVILFVDEIHTLVGAGNSSGSLDAANIFKPALARGELQCIGATTSDEYRESIEKDGALDRRFQKVVVEAPSAKETLIIIENIKDRYEEFHGVTYTPEAVIEIVRLSDRYMTNRQFPDKAIDVMDEAGSRSQIAIQLPADIKMIEESLARVREEKEEVIRSQRYEKAADLRDDEKKLIIKLETKTQDWKKELDTKRVIVDVDAISKVVAMMTGVPVSKVSQSEVKKILSIDSEIKSSVIGQDLAITTVANAIKRNRTGIRKNSRPIGTFLFVGPSGVGKTELAKVLARKVFGSDDALIKVDMSEYGEKHNVSKLIGSPPGYVGHDEGGFLTEKVKNKPYSVILFDEIEKAHKDVYNMMLQLFDEGVLTDGLSREVNFKNTIIIMTSNVGAKDVRDFGSGIGFNTNIEANKHEIFDKAVKDRFAPEFLNRIDDIIHFNTLNKENILDIIDLQLKELKTRLKDELGYNVAFMKSIKEHIMDIGYDERYGAREIQRAIQKAIEDPISNKLLELGLPTDIGRIKITYNTTQKETVVTIED